MLRTDDVHQFENHLEEEERYRTEDPLDDPRNRVVQQCGVPGRQEPPEQDKRQPPEEEAHDGHLDPRDQDVLPPPAPLLTEPPPEAVEAQELGDDHQSEPDECEGEGDPEPVSQRPVRSHEPADASRDHTQKEDRQPVDRLIAEAPDRDPTNEPHPQQAAEPRREDRAVERR